MTRPAKKSARRRVSPRDEIIAWAEPLYGWGAGDRDRFTRLLSAYRREELQKAAERAFAVALAKRVANVRDEEALWDAIRAAILGGRAKKGAK